MKTLVERQIEFIELFNQMDSWQDRFNYLIEIGSELPEIPGHLKTLATLIPFCQSRTYFHVSNMDGKIQIEGWSNASIPSGIIMMLKLIFDGQLMSELKDLVIDFHYTTGLMDHMTEQRKATLEEMIRRINQLC